MLGNVWVFALSFSSRVQGGAVLYPLNLYLHCFTLSTHYNDLVEIKQSARLFTYNVGPICRTSKKICASPLTCLLHSLLDSDILINTLPVPNRNVLYQEAKQSASSVEGRTVTTFRVLEVLGRGGPLHSGGGPTYGKNEVDWTATRAHLQRQMIPAVNSARRAGVFRILCRITIECYAFVIIRVEFDSHGNKAPKLRSLKQSMMVCGTKNYRVFTYPLGRSSVDGVVLRRTVKLPGYLEQDAY